MIDSVIFEFVLIKTTGFSSKADIITFGVEKINKNSNDIIGFQILQIQQYL